MVVKWAALRPTCWLMKRRRQQALLRCTAR
jgi:hypothetical protein